MEMTREMMAEALEKGREEYIEILKTKMLEVDIFSQDGMFTVEINTVEKLDLLIKQLRAPVVTAKEAMSPGLIWPRPGMYN